MKRMYIIGLSLMAVVAFGTVAVASASAEEILFLLGKGEFPATFKDKGVGVANLVTPAATVKCQEVESTGTIGDGAVEVKEKPRVVAHLGKAEYKFKGCKLFGLLPCSNAGAEEIVVKSAWFHLGLADKNKEKRDVPAILQLLPGAAETSEAGGKVNFECEGNPIEVVGSVIGELQEAAKTPWKPGVHLKEPKIEFAAEGGEQKYKEFLLSLAKEQLMTEVDLKSNKELAIEEATGTLKNIKNSAGEETTLGLKLK